MDLSVALANVGELKMVIADSLRKSGFTGVVNTQSEVAGNRSGVRVAVLHLHIGDTRFWQVVMGGGDAGDATQRAVNEVMDTIKNLKFL
jgi:hypothetical protein